jgi:hypothetical protein
MIDNSIENMIIGVLESNEFRSGGWLAKIEDKCSPETIKIILEKQSELDDKRIDIQKRERTNNHNTRERTNQFLHELDTEDREYAKEARLRYLKQNLDIYRNEIQRIMAYMEDLKRKNTSISDRMVYLELCEFGKKECKYNKLMNEFIYLSQDKSDKLTAADIERARTQPIEDILEVNKRGFAKCINHDDKNASLYCRNNFAYCFSCGFTGDVIALVMKIENLNFREAVKYLAR